MQNYKVYVGGKFARELEKDEQRRLDEFAAKIVTGNAYETQATTTIAPMMSENQNSTMADDPANDAPGPQNLVLDFCQEF